MLVELESPRRLSESRLWRMNREYFERTGVAAWLENVVPSYVTTNAFLARAYARVLHRWLGDCRAGADLRQPIRIVELGSATGKLVYLILRELDALERAGEARLPRYQLVITDCARANVEDCRRNPRLAPFVAAGKLDFAVCDAEADEPLILLGSGERLTAAGNPLALIANYVFDGIRHDAFRVHQGALHELHVQLAVDVPEVTVAADVHGVPAEPASLDQLTATWIPRAVDGPSYADPRLQSIVDRYQRTLAHSAFLIPVGAIACLRRFHRFAGGELLVLAADKGINGALDLDGHEEQGIAVHGSLSIGVNFHALGFLAEQLGGQAMHASSHGDLVASAFLFGDRERFSATRLAFGHELQDGGPLDFYETQRAIIAGAATLPLAALLSTLRLGGWDTSLFFRLSARLIELAGPASPHDARRIREAVAATAANLYPAHGSDDVELALGRTLHELGDHADAMPFLRTATELFPDDAETHFHLALCLHDSGDAADALVEIDRTLAIDPAHPLAPAARVRFAK